MVHFHHGNHSDPLKPIGNDSLDVACKGCFERFDTTACVRSGLMTLFVTVTGLLCAAKLHTQWFYSLIYALLYVCDSNLCVIYPQLHTQWFYSLIYALLYVCDYNLCVIYPQLHTQWFYSLIYALLYVCDYNLCVIYPQLHTQWFYSLIYALLYVCDYNLCVILVYPQLHTQWFYSLIYALLYVCDYNLCVIYPQLHTQWFYSLIYALLELLKFMLPIWTMLCVFHPVEAASTDFDSSWAEDGVSICYMLLSTKGVVRVVGPLFVLAFIYFTVIAVMGMLDARSSWVDCREPEWILLSSMEFVLVQLFLVSGIYITKKLNKISTQAETRREQKRDLWGLIGVFELSATVTLVYDINMLIWSDEDNGCSGVFLHTQWFYSLIYALLYVCDSNLCVIYPQLHTQWFYSLIYALLYVCDYNLCVIYPQLHTQWFYSLIYALLYVCDYNLCVIYPQLHTQWFYSLIYALLYVCDYNLCVILVYPQLHTQWFYSLIYALLYVCDYNLCVIYPQLHTQWFYSLIYALLELLKFMLPIWTMLCVFHPVEAASTDFDSSWAEDGTYTSVFSPQRGSRYRRLQNPTSVQAS
uniref:Uncharacterized protein n=1 Tax=Branchiostoma floridae TaxID=7739 RepID=C3ZW35_BRAFL|eukprot:XP_002587238.1 hypothetical protein BRAFLDRAFT_101958 [Branchiostoma floridae]